jgi:hypothetical protein
MLTIDPWKTKNGWHLSLGLAPLIVSQVFDALQALNRAGLTILLVEQNARLALEVTDRATSSSRVRSWLRAAAPISATTRRSWRTTSGNPCRRPDPASTAHPPVPTPS